MPYGFTLEALRHVWGSGRRSVAIALVVALTSCLDAGEPEGPMPGRPRFSGEAALELVRRQVAFGPRVPGSEGHALQSAWMLAHLDSLAPEVVADSFTWVSTSGDTLPLVNIEARFQPDMSRRILFLAHWDTRPRSDRASDPERRDVPVPGANDGASGTAVLLHLARLLSESPPPMGVDLLFVDGEDYGPGPEDMFVGARRYADAVDPEARPVYGVLLDMVGDADPYFPVEAFSAELAPAVVSKVWRVARRLGYGDVFVERVGERLGDDHIPLNQAGLPTINIIDFDYGPGNAWWHTPSDTPERVGAGTLEMVGEVVTELIYSGG